MEPQMRKCLLMIMCMDPCIDSREVTVSQQEILVIGRIKVSDGRMQVK